jgi:hypothetical protein
MKFPACHIFSVNICVEPDIRQDKRPDIRHPASPDIRQSAFRLAGYPAKSVSGASLLLLVLNFGLHSTGTGILRYVGQEPESRQNLYPETETHEKYAAPRNNVCY